MRVQGKNPPDLTNEEEIGSLPEKEFRIMIVKMIQNLGIERIFQQKLCKPEGSSRTYLK